MAGLVRVSPVDIPQHIIQGGNNRRVCFVRYVDMKEIGTLKLSSAIWCKSSQTL